jgi:hypothetical protein
MQDAGENLEAVDNTRPRAREVRVRIYEINFAVDRRGKGVEIWKTPKQLVITPRTMDIISAKSEYDNFGVRVDYLQPIDFCRRPMLPA